MRSVLRRVRPQRERASSIYRTYFLLLLLTIVITLSILWDTMGSHPGHQLISCYSQSDDNLLDILNEKDVKTGSFFFHETSCTDGLFDIKLNARQACSIESAALAHPTSQVYLLVLAPVNRSINDTQNVVVKELLTYSNVFIRRIEFNSYLEGTPLGTLSHNNALKRSRWPVSHASDILRYATLFKFRGTYLDLDVIVLKSLNTISNFVGVESKWSLGAGVINFSNDSTGNDMAEKCAEDLKNNYSGSEWGANGPGVITRVLQKRCNVSNVLDMINKNCQHFYVLPISAFYAFPFRKSEKFFKVGYLSYYKKILNGSYVAHFWNKFTSGFKMPPGDQFVPFLFFAKKHCPRVYQAVNGVF